MKRFALVVLAVTLFACVDYLPRDAIRIENRTDEHVRVVWRSDGSEGSLGSDVAPGADFQIREPCIEGAIVALSVDDGEEVDRIEGPVCRGDDTIVIDGLP